MGVSVGSNLDRKSAEVVWPDSETKIVTIAGQDKIAEDGVVNIIFPGLGQDDSDRAASQLFDALEGKEAVASVHYANQGINKEEVAEAMTEYLQENNITKIRPVGVSMGSVVAAEALAEIQEDNESEMPEIKDWVAYSSPYDSDDPRQSDLLGVAVKSKYPGGVASKFLYNYINEEGSGETDLESILEPLFSNKERVDRAKEAWKETFDDSSPRLYTSQLKMLADSDLSDSLSEIEEYFDDDAQLIYLKGEGRDGVVDVDKAYAKYADAFVRRFGIAATAEIVSGSGHAGTSGSARKFAEWLEIQEKECILHPDEQCQTMPNPDLKLPPITDSEDNAPKPYDH